MWAIPIRLTYSDGTERRPDRLLLTAREQDVELPADTEWVHVDSGGSGFYRTRYVGDLRRQLTANLGELLPLERYNLLDHEFACTLAGTATAAEFCELARSFGDDTELSVWQRLAAAFSALDRIIDTEARPRLQATVRAIAAPALHRMGWTSSEDESDVDRQRRACLFELLGTIGADDDVRARARTIHKAYLKSSDAVDPELVAAALAVIADSGTAEEFRGFLERWRKTDNPQEEMRYLYALPRFHDDASFAELLDLSLTEVRTQNAPFLLGRALNNRTHGPVAWQFVRRNWPTLIERFPSSTIVRMADGVKWLIDVAPDVEGFFTEHPVPQGAKTLAQHLERLRVNVAFRDREHAALAAAGLALEATHGRREPRQVTGEVGVGAGGQQHAEHDEQAAGDALEARADTSQSLADGGDDARPERGEQERHADASGIRGEQQRAARGVGAARGDEQRRAEQRADAGAPRGPEGDAEHERAERSPALRQAMHEPALLQPATAQHAEQHEAEHEHDHPADALERVLQRVQRRAQLSRGGAQTGKHEREAGDEHEGGRHRLRGVTRLDRLAYDEPEVRGHEGHDAGREERRDTRAEQRDVGPHFVPAPNVNANAWRPVA